MAKDKERKQEIAVKQKGDLMLNQFEEEAGAGMEGMTQADYAIPFLAILQNGSPQLNRTDGSYIKGAVAGQILHTVNNKLFDQITVIPCAFSHRIVEWKPRGSGGGLVAQYERESAPTDTTVNDKGQMVRPSGNVLLPTAYHYVIILDPEAAPEPGVIAMTSTQLKKSKKWNSLMASLKLKGRNGLFTPPTYAYQYILSTVGESNDKGNWFGWDITQDEIVDSSDMVVIAKDLARNARQIGMGAMRSQQQEAEI